MPIFTEAEAFALDAVHKEQGIIAATALINGVLAMPGLVEIVIVSGTAIQNIVAGAPHQGVVTNAAVQFILPSSAIEIIVAIFAVEHVIAIIGKNLVIATTGINSVVTLLTNQLVILLGTVASGLLLDLLIWNSGRTPIQWR